ncbi:MAG: DNA cytosine methyltransferase, partial [Gammaproteobacteria bacterium]|nr:DNA cytosine methyltransferase [Gammaproteobacteria bacterium]
MSLIIFDLFSGTGSATQAFKEAQQKVYTFELDTYFQADENVDVFDLTVDYLREVYGQPDFVWASPPCTAFSVASMGHHWQSGGSNPVPKTQAAMQSQELVAHTRKLLEGLNPKFGFLIENPRGMLRKLPVVKDLQRQSVTYCQYGDTRMKPTDLWGVVPNWTPRPMCKNGASCHEAAPRGSKTGTQGLQGSKERS